MSRTKQSSHSVCLVILLLVCGCAFSQTAPSADDTETRGRKLLKEAIAALGGDAYLSAKDFTLSGRFYQIYHGVTSGAAVFVDYIKYPDKERQEIGKKKESIIIYNGDQGWDIDYRAVRAMTFEQMESYHRDQRYSLDRVLRFDLKANKYRIYYDGSDLIEATRYDMVTLEDANRERMSILLNSRTHLPEALRYRLVDPKTGGVDRMESWYGNFQLVEGIMTAFHRERIRNGERISETFVNSMKYNSGLSDSLFTPR